MIYSQNTCNNLKTNRTTERL